MKIGSLLIDMAVDLARLRSDMDQAKNTVDGAMRDMARAASNLKKLLGGVGAALALIGSGGVFARITSEMTDYEARLARVVGGHDAARAAMGRLNDMALRTYSSFGQTAEGYLQNESALRAMGYSTRQTMNYVETLNNALVVSGAKGERAATVQVALQKAMMLGKLSGDQLNAVIASGGRVAELLAEKLGVTTNQLLELGTKGKITASVIYDALAGNMQKIRKEAEEMPVTILDGFARISTVAAKMVYDFDQSTGASKAVATALVWVADNMGLIVQWGTPVAAALLAIAAPTIISGVLAVATALAKAAAGLALLAVANPLVTLAAGAAAAIAALVVFRDEIKLGADETTTLADLGKAAFDDLAGGATTLWDTVKSAFAGQRDEITKTNTVAADSAAAQEASWLAMVRSVLVAFDAMGGFVRGFFAGWGETIAAVTSATIDRFMGMGRAVRKVLMGDITGALAELQTSAALDVKQIFLDAMDRSFESQKSSGLEARLDQWVASARAASAAAAAAAKTVGDASDDSGKKITNLSGAIKKVKDEFAELMARLNAKDAGVDPKFAEELAILKKGLDAGRIGMDDYIVTVQRLIGQQQFAKDAAAAEAKAFDDLMAAQDKAREKNEGQIRTARQMLEQIQFETSLLKMNTRERTVATAMRELERQGIVKGTQAYEAYADQIRAALIDKDTVEATIKAQDEVAEGWKRTSEQIGQQFTDALIQGGASVKEALKRMFQNMVLRPIIQPIMTTVGGVIASLMGSGPAMAGQGASSAMNLLNIGSTANSLLGGITGNFLGGGTMGAMFANISAGFTTGLSTLFTEGIGAAFSQAVGLIGAGSMGGGMGAMLGAAALPALGVGLLLNGLGLFRGTHKRGDLLMGTLGEAGGVRQGDLMRRDGTLFGGPDWFVDDKGASALDKAIQAQFDASIKQVVKFADSLGLATDAADGFKTTLGTETIGDHGQIGIRLDKDGTPLSDQEVQAKIAEAIKSADNELAQQLIGTWEEVSKEVTRSVSEWLSTGGEGRALTTHDVTAMETVREYTPSEYAREGEEAIDTLTRLGSSLAAANGAFQALNLTAFEGSLAGADMASKLVDATGGLEAFGTKTTSYFQSYYSQIEQQGAAYSALTGQFADLNQAVPASRSELRALVDSLDLTTEAGRTTFGSLMSLQDGFAGMMDAAQQATGISSDSIKQLFDNFLSTGADVGQAFGELFRDGVMNAMMGNVSDLLMNQLVAPLLDSVMSQSLAASSMLSIGGVEAANAMAMGGAMGASASAQGGAAAASAMASGGASAGSSMATGGAIAGATVSSVVDQAKAYINAMSQIMADPDIQAAIKDVGGALGSVAGSFKQAQVSFGGGGGYSGAGKAQAMSSAADDLANKFKKLGDAVDGEIKRLRGLTMMESERGQAELLARFASNTAAARAGSEDAFGTLVGLSRDIEKITADTALSSIENVRMRAWLANSLEETMKAVGVTPPAFAAGGLHTGGLRIVGELGPEIEATGPSRIWNQKQIGQALSGGSAEVVNELRTLRAEVAALRAAVQGAERNTRVLPRMADQIDNVTEGGNAMRAEIMNFEEMSA